MNSQQLTDKEKRVLKEVESGTSMPFSFMDSDRKNAAKRKILQSLERKGFVYSEAKADGLHYYPIDYQKQIDEVYDTLYLYWREKGLSYREAEIMSIIDQLPEEKLPTKYKELKKTAKNMEN